MIHMFVSVGVMHMCVSVCDAGVCVCVCLCMREMYMCACEGLRLPLSNFLSLPPPYLFAYVFRVWVYFLK